MVKVAVHEMAQTLLQVLLLGVYLTGFSSALTIGYGNKFDIKVPQGAKDALPYFQQAMKTLTKAKGGTLSIGQGTFILGNQWSITASKLTIKGQGMGKTILKLKDNAPAFKGAGFITSGGTNNVIMMDLTVDGNKKMQNAADAKLAYGKYCMYVQQYRNWIFRRMECQNNIEYGFDPHGVKKMINGMFDRASAIFSYNLTIEDCLSHDNGWDCFTVDQTIGVVVRNNTGWNCGRHGINIVTASSDVLVENNKVFNCGNGGLNFGCGLLADTNRPGFITSKVVFKNNQVTGQGTTGGACVKGATDILFTGNTIKNSVTCATFMKNAAGVRFVKNKCINVKKDFAYQNGGVKPTITGNTVTKTAG